MGYETLEMFSKQERRKRKYKFDGAKVCTAEEARKYFVNPKIESFRLVFKFAVWISDSQKQSFADVLRKRCS